MGLVCGVEGAEQGAHLAAVFDFPRQADDATNDAADDAAPDNIIANLSQVAEYQNHHRYAKYPPDVF